MKIVYISSSIIPSTFANSIQVMKMAESFALLGYEVILLARRGDFRLYKSSLCLDVFEFYGVRRNFRIMYLPWPKVRAGGVIYGFRSIQTLLHLKPDIVYARNIYGGLIAAWKGFPTIYEVHALPHNSIHRIMHRFLLSSKNLKRVVVISKALYHDYSSLYPWFSRIKIQIAHDGASLPYFTKSPKIDWPGRKGVLQVGYIGSLYPGKGVEIGIELAKRLPEMDFHIVGGGEKEIRFWRKRAPYPNLYFHGFVPPGLTYWYQQKCDVLILPAQVEVYTTFDKRRQNIARWMSPLKLFEYMAAKRPIIASNLPTVREVLKDGENAILVDPKKIEAWVDALYRLLRFPDLRKRLAERAFEEYKRKYTWLQRAKNVLQGL